MKSSLTMGLGLLSLAFLVSLLVSAANPIPAECKTGGFAIGCQAYSFKSYTVLEAIDKTAQTGGKIIELFPKHKFNADDPKLAFDHNATDAMVATVKAKLAEKGIKAVNYGVIAIPNDEAAARKIFDFAKKMGLYAITTESTDSIDLIEKLVKEYDIKVGYHNHPKKEKDANYKVWDPNYVAQLVKGRDPRIGAAADTGHWARSGVKPVDGLKALKGRLVSIHLKDLNEFGKREVHDVPYGTGVCDIKSCLDELKAQGFQGNIAIEYEYNWESSVPEIKQCIDFVRAYGK